MLDGNRYFAEFPDEDPARQGRPPLGTDLIRTLAAIEKEIRLYIETGAAVGASIAGTCDHGK
jgi:hypothetical protein